MIGIIGGTGLQNIDALNIIRESFIDTPYGKPSDKVVVGKLENHDVVFLPRHGNEHTVPPHLDKLPCKHLRTKVFGYRSYLCGRDCRLHSKFN